MDIRKDWYKSATLVGREYVLPLKSFVIYKGIKITSLESGSFTLEETRYKDDYEELGGKKLKQIETHGFKRGCDILSWNYNQSMVDKSIKTVEKMYSKRNRFTRELTQGKAEVKNTKRIKNLNINIGIVVNDLWLYKFRVEQFEKKYNLN